MLRACTDELTANPGFKFRRSAFKGQEPKVTLMAEINGRTIPIDFSVNTTTPLYNAALLTECGQIEPRAKELILLVRRWAKDRGVSHAAKGHLSPYAWSHLAFCGSSRSSRRVSMRAQVKIRPSFLLRACLK